MRSAAWKVLLLPALALARPAPSQTAAEKVDQALAKEPYPGVIRSVIGITRRETLIPSMITADDLNYNTPKTRVLLVGGLDGSAESVEAVLDAMRWFYGSPFARRWQARFAVSAVPIANPDGWAVRKGPSNGSGGNPTRGYPPKGDAYSSPTNPEAAYLWRWIGMHAPDLVVDVRPGKELAWQLPDGLGDWTKVLSPAQPMRDSDELVPQLVKNTPSGTGSIPAVQVRVAGPDRSHFLRALLVRLRIEPSPARREIQRRLARRSLQIANQLGERYGHEFEEAVYIPSMALVGRLRLGEITGDARHLADIERIVAPYYEGQKPALPAKPTGSHVSGHLVFGELFRLTSKQRYLELARAAADLGFDEQGMPKPSMPYHNEMSDAVFMGCPILAQVGRLTGEAKYFDMCLRHMRFMLNLNLRPDGLHRHSPLNEAAWGRGNGFPALGLALSLSDLPEDHPGRDEMLRAFRAHMQALARYQDPTGAWRQVIDVPGSYRELTATCMIAFAMERGVRLGWLDRTTYQPLVDRAWYAIRTRVAPDGGLVDVCTSTGKQKTLRDYLDRTAILGPDPRGGAMALLIATEMTLRAETK